MANEITLTLGLQVSKGGVTETLNPGVKQFNMTGTNIVRQTATAPITTPGAIDIGGITTPGFVLVHNLDVTNFVTLYGDVTGTLPVAKIRPGGYALFEFAVSAPFWKADTAPCKCEYLIVEL